MRHAEPTGDQGASGFAALGLARPLLEALSGLGYEEPTPIQRAAIPPLLAGRDVLAQAATGTGKTAAFALPLLQRTTADVRHGGDGTRSGAHSGVRALVLVPTRELAIQVAESIHGYGRALGGRTLAVYGGQPIREQMAPLRRGVDVVVATPGRALDHIRRSSLALDGLRVLVLDEADEMLDMGFADDLEAILEAVPKEHQTALFSATLPRRIAALAERHLDDPVRIVIPAARVAAGEVPRLRQVAYVVPRRDKIGALARVLDVERPASTIVFCRTRTEVDELAATLAGLGYRCEPLHGGRSQEERGRVMRRFRNGAVDVLVATDVAARGLDIEHVSHVVNFDVPCSTDAYIHRVGRTGRAGRAGVAITIAEPRERRHIRTIEQVLKHRIRIAELPTREEAHARSVERATAALRAAATGDLAAYRSAAERLAADCDPIALVSAALKLTHEGAAGGRRTALTAASDVPAGPLPGATSTARPSHDGGARRAGDRRQQPRPDRATRTTPREARPARRAYDAPSRVRLRLGLGRRAGLRTGDVVGAIANEAGLDAGVIGAIDVGERSSTVEVPADATDAVMRALARTTIRGRSVVVKRDEADASPRRGIRDRR